MKHFKLFFALFAMLALGVGNAWAEEVTINFGSGSGDVNVNDFNISTTDTYGTIWSISTVATNKSFTPNANYSQIGASSKPATSITLTGTITKACTVNSITSKWGGFSGTQGNVAITVKETSYATGTLNANTDVNVGATNDIIVAAGDKIVITVTNIAKGVKLYSLSYTYTQSTGGGETPDPEDPTPGAGGTGTINFNSNAVKINAASVTGQDDLNNTWTITTVGTTSFTSNSAYYQVGSGSKPATSITFTTTLPQEGTVTDFSAKFGGFSGTAGTVTLKVDDTSVGTGSLNGTSDVTVENSSEAIGKTLTVTVTGIAKGVKVYYISYTYTSSGSGSTEPVPSVTLDPSVKDFGTVNVGETPSQEFTITTENTTASLTASIDNTTDYAVSDIAGNKVTVTYQPQSAGTHPAVLTVKAGEEATATVNLTGKAVEALEGTWILVTDASSLNVGDKIIIAAKESDVALSTTQAGNNRPEVAITKNDNTITATSETQVLTLEAGNKENTLALYTGDGYLYAASSGSNYLRTETTLSDNSSWSIAVAADGTATLIAQGTNTRNTLYYNKNSKIFSCYSNAQQPIALYKNTNGKLLAGLAYATTKYLTKLGDAFTTPTLTNPNSLTVTYSSSDNNVATVDNTGTVTIKAAGVVVITAAFAGDASYLEGSAKYTLCVTEHAGTEADPYSVADARRVIDVMETAEGVYATGIVSEIVTAYNSTYGNISYNISADGLTTSDQLQAYRGKSYDGANFTSADDVKVGDEVVIKGTLKKYSTTYEFDENNQLVSLNRTKEQAGLAYEETEHTANVGEDFAEPTLTNPNSLSITYSSNNTSLATVDATTGEVSILAAGKVTITASSAADATYAAGSASYNITITDPSLAVATLPFYFDGKKADIEGTAGMTQSNLGTDYAAAPYLKFNAEGAWAIVQFDSEPGEFSFLLKQNGESIGTFTVYESENGEDYTPIWSGGDLGGNAKSATIEPTLSATARYVKFEYTTKPTGTNYGLGAISIKKADHRQEAGLAWNPETVTLTVGDAFTAPTFSNPNSLAVSFESSNTELATVTNAGVISLVSGKTGTATITATFADGHADYKPAEATCVITVSPKSEKVVILAQYGDQWYALKAAYLSGKTDRLDAIPVNYVGGKLYNVAEADKASIEWSSVVEGDKVSFLNDGKYLKGKTSTTLLFEEDADGLYQWDNTTYTMTIGTTVRSFLYNGEAFRNFAVLNAGKVVNDVLYSSLPVVTAPVYATGDAYSRSTTAGKFGTICLPFGSTKYTGATFYEFVGSETGKVYLGSVTTLEAGVPYIFEASAAEVAVYGDGTTAVSPGSKNGLVGTFTNDTEVAVGNYILLNNELRQAAAICYVNANRAYIVMSEVPTGVPTQMPGRRYIGMSVQGENEATGFENIVAPEGQAVKAIVNGQLIIIRDGVKYNVQGVRL